MKVCKILIKGTAFIIFCSILWPGCTSDDWSDRQVLRAVPPTSGLVIGWEGVKDFPLQPDSASFETALPEGLQRDLHLYREFLQYTDSLLPSSTEHPLVLFLEENGPEGPAFGAILDLGGAELPVEAVPGFQAQGAPTRYRDHLVRVWKTATGNRITLARHGNLWLMGRFPFLVEEVIGHLDEGRAPAFEEEGLLRFRDSGVTLWLQGRFLNVHWPDSENFWPDGWLQLGVKVDSSMFKIEGDWFPQADAALPWLAGTSPAPPGDILTVIPEQVAWAGWSHFDDPEANWPPVGNDLLRSFFFKQAGAEQAHVAARIYPGGRTDRVWVLELDDPERGRLLLDSLASQVGVLEEFDHGTYFVRQLLSNQLQPPGWKEQVFTNPYVTVLDGFLLLSNSRTAIELWIDQYLFGATLINSQVYQAFFRQNRSEAGVRWIVRPPLIEPALDGKPLTGSLSYLLNEFPLAGLQWTLSGGKARVEGTWPRLRATSAAAPNFLWRTPLAAPSRIAPQFISGPGGDGIVLQDTGNELYFLDATSGRIKWQIELSAPVLPPFRIIDFYRDGETQLVFSTSEALHIVDTEAGAPVGRYPMAFQSPATSGPTVIDTTGAGGYAFFVPSESGSLYGYTREGLPLPGWNPRSGTGVVPHPILHFQETGKDYFVGMNEAGTLHVMRRNGANRFPPLVFHDTFPSPPAYQLYPGASRIVACNQDGVAYVANLEGSYFRLRLRPPDSTGSQRPVTFFFADVAGDGRNDYVSLAGRSLMVHAYSGNNFRRALHMSYERPPEKIFPVDLPGREKAAIGAVDGLTRKIFLHDGNGKAVPGFPLAGSTPFFVVELDGSGNPVVVVADEATVYAYELPGGH